MKYICTNPFPNPPGNPIVVADTQDASGKLVKQSHVVIGGKEQKGHIHKGAIFNIGTATDFKELSPSDRTLVSLLAVSKKIAEATPQTIERVNKEVAAEDLVAKRDAERDAKSDPMKVIADALAGLPDMIAAAVAAAVGKKA